MNTSEFKEVVNASKERTWEVLFNQFGDIHVHNPTMVSSNYLNNASIGELNCVRHCMFNEKLFLDEKISEVNKMERFTVEVINHNLPFVKEMAATYELVAIGKDMTEVRMTSSTSFSIGFMKYLMRGQMGKSLVKHLFGLKYYLETGKTVNAKNYSEVYKNYNR